MNGKKFEPPPPIKLIGLPLSQSLFHLKYEINTVQSIDRLPAWKLLEIANIPCFVNKKKQEQWTHHLRFCRTRTCCWWRISMLWRKCNSVLTLKFEKTKSVCVWHCVCVALCVWRCVCVMFKKSYKLNGLLHSNKSFTALKYMQQKVFMHLGYKMFI